MCNVFFYKNPFPVDMDKVMRQRMMTLSSVMTSKLIQCTMTLLQLAEAFISVRVVSVVTGPRGPTCSGPQFQ